MDLSDQNTGVVIATLWVGWSAFTALVRVFGAKTFRTFMLRLVMGGQRVAVSVVVATIFLALWRGGIGFFGAPIFVAAALLVWWTLRTLEAWVDRRDRFVWVIREYG